MLRETMKILKTDINDISTKIGTKHNTHDTNNPNRQTLYTLYRYTVYLYIISYYIYRNIWHGDLRNVIAFVLLEFSCARQCLKLSVFHSPTAGCCECDPEEKRNNRVSVCRYVMYSNIVCTRAAFADLTTKFDGRACVWNSKFRRQTDDARGARWLIQLRFPITHRFESLQLATNL